MAFFVIYSYFTKEIAEMRFLKAVCLLAVAQIAWSYVQFQHVLVPFSEDQESVIATRRATIGSSTPEGFHKIARTRELHNCVLPGCTLMGEVLDIRQNNITSYDPDTLEMRVRTVRNRRGKSVERMVEFSHAPSAGVLIHEEISDRWYMIYQFEEPNPGTLYRMWLSLVNDTQISTKLSIPINLSHFGGLWKPRVAIPSPTNTLLGTEGIPPDGRLMETVDCLHDPDSFDCLSDLDPDLFYDLMDFMRYFDRPVEALKEEGQLEKSPKNGIPGFKPYRYGYPYELQLHLNDFDRVLDDVQKLYAMGRTGASGIAVMQNGFTVYISGGHGGLFRFVDEVGGFMSGELSAAVFTLREVEGPETHIRRGTVFDIEWVKIGTGDAVALGPYVDPSSETEFSDLLFFADFEDGECPDGYDFAKVGDRVECLRIRDDDAAGILEPERVGALKGATMDVFRFSQMATQLDEFDFYIGATDISRGVMHFSEEEGATLIADNACGCVFRVNMDESYNAVNMEAVMCGEEVESSSGALESCSTESIANPRALTYAHQFEQILVGEDSEYHENNFVWAIDVETDEHVRIFHAPREGGVTSLNWYQDVIGGNNYIGITIRNPYDSLAWMSYFGSFELEYQKSLAFSDVAVPYDVGPKNLPIGFARVTSGETDTFAGFRSVVWSGMQLSGQNGPILIGEVLDANSNPVDRYIPAPVEPRRTDSNEVSHAFGFSTFLESCGTTYAVISTDSLPGMSYVIPLEKTKNKLEADAATIVDWSSWGGLWRSGGGTVSPWNTYVSGETHEPDGLDLLGYQCITGFSSCFKSQAERSFDDSIHFLRYHDIYIADLENKFEPIAQNFNPYEFGYAYEIRINKDGCVRPEKFMTLGRFSHGGISIMPDGKTVYMTDYTTGRDVGGGLFRFVAKKANDLSSGTLYAAKFKATKESQQFKVDWIKLGKADNDELIERAKDIRFTDMFDYIPSSRNCRLDQINVKSQLMCLRVKPGMEKWAAFFETRRYAALQGATVELANTRGITFDAFSARLYFSFSSISARDKIMLQDDVEGSSNDLKFPSQPCGCIYAMALSTSYEAFEMEGFECGTNLHGNIDINQCSVEHLAGPKDLTHIPGHGQLLVAEDSCYAPTENSIACGHENNALWSITTDRTTEFTRLLTAPRRTTVSSPNWHPDIKGNSYLTVTLNEQYNDLGGLVDFEEPSAVFGYVGPIIKAGTPGLIETEPKCYNKRDKDDQCYTT